MAKTILILEDKDVIVKILLFYLSDEYNVVYFENPLLAIKWIEEGNLPDLIVSDIYMPLMTGSDFLYFMKGSELYNNIPIVILSVEDSSTERIKLLKAGAADFILKPFNPEELKVRLNKILV